MFAVFELGLSQKKERILTTGPLDNGSVSGNFHPKFDPFGRF